MKLLLHACCGPCLLEPYDELARAGDEVTVVYANPNIHPAEEYERRRDTLANYAAEAGIEWVEIPYDPASWMERVAPLARDRLRRCRACYRLRFESAAEYAVEHGFDAIATTLSVSPYQDADAIAEEGEAVAAAHGLEYVRRDFRDRYPEATRRSRELGMYRQNYCGCVLSDVEARQDRERSRAERRAARQQP